MPSYVITLATIIKLLEAGLVAHTIEELTKAVSEFQGHHTNQACYKSGITSPEYPELLLFQVSENIRQQYGFLLPRRAYGYTLLVSRTFHTLVVFVIKESSRKGC